MTGYMLETKDKSQQLKEDISLEVGECVEVSIPARTLPLDLVLR